MLFEDLKERVFCTYHNSFFNDTNDCNAFWGKIQPAINDGRLNFVDMQIDKQAFLWTRWSWMERRCSFGSGSRIH